MTATFLDLVDLASERLGGSVVAANDEFFAPKEGLINAAAPIWIEGKYTERGKWMDGWETRRRRDGGDHDWCIVRLGVRGVVRGVDVETTFFKGNFPESCAVDACDASPLAAADELSRASWREIVSRTTLAGDSHNAIAASVESQATHVRLRIFPDGGVARLRVHADRGWKKLDDFVGLRRDRVVSQSKIRRPDEKDYRGGYDAEGYAEPVTDVGARG